MGDTFPLPEEALGLVTPDMLAKVEALGGRPAIPSAAGAYTF
jgi:hypothetical protein